MKELKCQLQAIADTISLLSKQFEIVANRMESLESLYEKRAFSSPAAASSEPVMTAGEPPLVTQTADDAIMKNEYSQPLEVNASSIPEEGEIRTPDTQPSEPPANVPVLSTVLDVIRRSRKGVGIAQIRKKTNFSPRQISNALYKLSRVQGKIEAQSRGVYVIKKNNN